ncbi:MAG: LysR family transcriptional regulator [Treponema sp.]|nr:LysR family transcriptional regulator [Treponema sp.]
METYIIEQLAAVAKYGTLSRVAEELHISQPALSRSMQKLEDELGVKLFDRSKNRIALNELGELAARHAEVVLTAHNEMIRAVQEADRRSHTFSYGSIAPAPMWEMIPILSQLYMGMTVSADLQESDDVLVRGLDDGTYSLIILTHPLDDNAAYFSKPFIKENLSIVVPKNHRLAERASITLKDLAGEKILIHNKIGFWYGVCKEKIPNATYLEQSELSAMQEIVNATELPSFITDVSNKKFPAPKGKIAVPITDKEVNVQFYCVCKSERAKEFAAIFSALKM